MKTKQKNLLAKFTKKQENAKNLAHEKETIAQYVIVDKKTEKEVIVCRVYMGRSSSANTVYASIWVNFVSGAPEGWEHGRTSGHGRAVGWGYHKESAAIDSAISSAGIELYGSVYKGNDTRVNMKKRTYIGGTGCHESALLAIAYAAGCKDAIFVRA